MLKMSYNKDPEIAEPRTDDEQPKPDPIAYGGLVDKMVATVATWPPEYQRSVDVHHLSVQSHNA